MTDMADSFISLIVPAYKQERTIVEDVISLDRNLSSFTSKYEIIIVIDGFVDKSYEKLKKLKNAKIKVLGYEENKGKGFAIKLGVEKAKGDIIGFIDAGLDLSPSEISLMLNIMEWNNADIVIGSKLHPESIIVYPTSRRILSWGYRTLIKMLFNLSIKDSQVGLKFFKRKAAKEIFPKIIVKAFAFDIEVLAVATLLGYDKIIEAPIQLNFKQGSITNSNFWKVAFSMLVDTVAVFYRIKVLRYYK